MTENINPLKKIYHEISSQKLQYINAKTPKSLRFQGFRDPI